MEEQKAFGTGAGYLPTNQLGRIWRQAWHLPCLQVLEEYAKYADDQIASSCNREDGRRGPSVRVLFKPLMGMFHNEPRGKKWRAAVGRQRTRVLMQRGTGRASPCKHCPARYGTPTALVQEGKGQHS